MREVEAGGLFVRRVGARRLFVAAAVAVLLVLTIPQARADQSEEAQTDPGLSGVVDGRVTAGFDGHFVPGRPVPVKVELSASQLLTGELRVELGGQSSATVPFEIAADTSEAHWVLIDTPLGDAADVASTVTVDDRRTRLDPSIVNWERNAHLLGTLPGVGAGGPPAEPVHTRLLDQPITFVPLDPALLDLGPRALSALDSVAATADDLADLSEPHRDAVVGWLADGGTLYVDSAGPIDGWPEPYQPGHGVVRHGAATIRTTEGALAAGQWDRVVLPAPNRSIHEDGEAAANIPWGDAQNELFNTDLGRDLPPLPGLLAVLGVYILVVGPITYLVFRGRATARWVAVPVLALLATGVVFVNADGLGTSTTAAVIDVVEFGPGSAMATSRVLLATEGGHRDIAAPPGWMVELDESMGGFSEVEQRRGADGVRFRMPAPAGGVGFLGAAGPVDVQGALEVTATATGEGQVTGTVRNTLDVTLEDVAIFVGRNASVPVGTLEPGAESDFEVTGTTQFRFGADPFMEHWGFGMGGGFGGGMDVGPVTTMAFPGPDPAPPPPGMLPGNIVSIECDEFGNCTQCDDQGNCFGDSVPCDQFGNCPPAGGVVGRVGAPMCDGGGCESLARPGTLTAAFRERGSNAMPSGMVTAVGWTSAMQPVLDLGGGLQLSEVRTALVARAFPEPDGERLVDAGVVRTVVSVEMRGNDGLLELVQRLDLPPGVDHPERLRIDVPESFVRASFLTPTGATVIRDLEAGVGDPAADAPVPAEAIMDGHVFVRGAIRFEPPPPGREMVLYEAPGP